MPLAPPIDAPPETVIEALSPLRNDFSVAVLSPGNAFAVGAIVRVAHSFLAREILVVGREPYYAKASMGMHKYETIRRLPDVAALRAHARGRPLWVVEKDHARRSVQSVRQFPAGVVLVFGSERFGVPAELVESADDVIGIPIYGVNHSLPVTVAAGIVMHEWARRRYGDGNVM
ncbi:MAG TPA: TrmH family RNA methyltransferase [Polyangiaceae bacterium]|nr:TrmH family RNA methyltransferase [Polyangiaceae bacterium]